MTITVIEPLPKPLPANPALVTRWPIGRQIVHAQARFLGYLDTLAAHPTETLWLCAAQREGTGYRRDRYQGVFCFSRRSGKRNGNSTVHGRRQTRR